MWQNFRISSLIWWISIKLDCNFKNSLTPLCEQKLKSSSAQGEEIIIYVFWPPKDSFAIKKNVCYCFSFTNFFLLPTMVWQKKKDNVLKNCNHINSVALRLPLLGVLFCAKSQIPNQKIKGAQCSTYLLSSRKFSWRKNGTSF